jgi:formamidopyrimidine-DNA glycosylase
MTALAAGTQSVTYYGNKGGYVTILIKNTVGKPCPRCGTLIEKTAYMGGAYTGALPVSR